MQKCTEPKCYECEICIEKPACRWCEYFAPEHPNQMIRNELLDGDSNGDGQCHCHQPQLGHFKKDKYGDLEQMRTTWPLIPDFEWCGDFKERTDLVGVAETAIKDAENFIKELLSNGLVTNGTIRSNAINAGIRMNAILLASRNLKIFYSTMSKPHDGWTWKLPNTMEKKNENKQIQ